MQKNKRERQVLKEQLELSQHCSSQPGRDLIQQVEVLWSTSFNNKDAVKESEIEAAWNLVEQRIVQPTPVMDDRRFSRLTNFLKRSILIKASKFVAAACLFFYSCCYYMVATKGSENKRSDQKYCNNKERFQNQTGVT